ncbi:pentatricopeptide repeat-containing protein [Striga asiatica]|uniref:Pentatricopeptide repeat-containing protein n=1 Tax=Striga asiatica TaxID=4170 RepID=A0A5A7Q7T0_STRAF|nr:pentatricopeptide repeat-containing protein [Striga asiatica]
MPTTLLPINTRKILKPFINKAVNLLESYTSDRLLSHGKALHCHLIKTGLSSQKYIAVKLLIMYLDSRESLEIDRMLQEFNGFNLVAYNCLITANLQWGNVENACNLFDELSERNEVSWTSLISGLLKHGNVDRAMSYFEMNPFSNVFTWTATINGLVQNGLSYRAMNLYRKMLRARVLPNDITFTTVVRACVELGDLGLGKTILGLIVKLGFDKNVCVLNSLVMLFLRSGEIDTARKMFDQIEQKDVVSWTTILDMYVQMGDLGEALRVFDKMPERNEVSWSAIISRFSQSGNSEEAFRMFGKMLRHGFKPNVSCYSSVISALASLVALEAGKSIHARVSKVGLDKNVFVGSSLVDLYCKCSKTQDGRSVFDETPNKNIVCWNSMLSGYSLNGELKKAIEIFKQMPEINTVSWNSLIAGYLNTKDYKEALKAFDEMILLGHKPNKSTFSCVLRACANLASLERGRRAHAKALKLDFHHDVYVGTALVDMYAKSGSVECSRKVFRQIPAKNEVVWTAMIQGLAENGLAQESLALFEEMERKSSVRPNELILSSVLFSCSHCGLVDKGLDYFDSMERVNGVRPNERHYAIVADMLSRSGRLEEAEDFITRMPFEPDVNVWAALLSGCKKFGDEKLAGRVAERMAGMLGAEAGRAI